MSREPRESSSAEGDGRRAEVVLVSMPFGPLHRPSIGLGLLQAALKSAGVSSKTLYFTFPFAELIGATPYRRIAAGHPEPTALLGEWIFAADLFGESAGDPEAYLGDVSLTHPEALRNPRGGGSEAEPMDDFQSLLRSGMAARARVGEFLDACLEQIEAHSPSIVGFTSVFQQQLASLALGKRLKARQPETFILIGGANCEGAMGAEVVRQFPFVDAVVSGEGDTVFPELVRRVLDGEAVSGLQGVYTRGPDRGLASSGRPLNAPMTLDMDRLPYPDYEDFFQQLAAARPGEGDEACLLFESSRGCWWGEINHCTFCGLNGSTMAYRSKSGRRALDELLYLAAKHPHTPVEAVDNILDMGYFKDFIPELATRRINLHLFYEVKSNLKKEQVRLLRDAGIGVIQPGIESLSTPILALMRKGVTRLQNIQLLKWCKEYGVKAQWNLLWGFPGERPEEYASMAELVPLLTHLSPPETMGRLRLDRFSPYFNNPEQFGITDMEPYPTYRHVYPFPAPVLSNLAYYFSFQCRESLTGESYTAPLAEQVRAWQEGHEQSDLFFKEMDSYILVFDLRPTARERLTVLTGIQKFLYTACDTTQTVRALSQSASRMMGREVPASEVEEAAAPLLALGLLTREGNSLLSLAVPLGEYSPKKSTLELFFGVEEVKP